jgi:hypothetical protein
MPWSSLNGDDLETQYRHTLEELGKRPGMLGVIFKKAQRTIQAHAKLRHGIGGDAESGSGVPPLEENTSGVPPLKKRQDAASTLLRYQPCSEYS